MVHRLISNEQRLRILEAASHRLANGGMVVPLGPARTSVREIVGRIE